MIWFRVITVKSCLVEAKTDRISLRVLSEKEVCLEGSPGGMLLKPPPLPLPLPLRGTRDPLRDEFSKIHSKFKSYNLGTKRAVESEQYTQLEKFHNQ